MGWAVALFLAAGPLPAQETNDVEQLRRQVKQLQADLEKTQQEHQRQIEALTKKLDDLLKRQQAAAEQEKLKQELAAELQTNAGARSPAPATAPAPAASWSPAQPISVGRAGSAYMNISFDALANFGGSTQRDPAKELELGDHDPIQRGFSLRNAEISLDGAVDPYFKGFANIVMKLDHDNNTDIELEETYLQSIALPANLQLKAGQFFANFGRQNPQHPHQWAFVDDPLALARAFGPDGLRNLGGQLSWLVPTPFYSELFLGVFNGQGTGASGFRDRGQADAAGIPRVHGRATLDRGLRGPGDLLFVPRYATSFDLTDNQTLVLGASAAFGPNDTSPDARTQVYGVDAYWKWKPADAMQGFPFVSWQTEGLYSHFDAGADPTAPTPVPAQTLEDWGGYTQVLWGFRPRWVAGLRGEFVTDNSNALDASDPFRGDRTRVSPNLTWYPSEFSKIRLQYNYDQGEHFGTAHSIWLQVEFLLGSHAAHKF